MAEHQVTHDNETLEEKEQKIQDFLDEHGLTIEGAPRVRHQEANVILDDVRYPKFLPPDNEESNNSNTGSAYDGVDIFDTLEDIPAYSEPKVQLISPHLNSSRKSYNLKIPSCTVPQTGLCFEVEEIISYSFTIARKTGIYKVPVKVGDILSVLTYDGQIFKTYVGKVCNFYLRSTATDQSCVKTEVFMIIDTTPKPFESSVEIVSSNQIVDIGDRDKVWDITEYGVDIKKRYFDWCEELRNEKQTERLVTIAPSGNLKEYALPPLESSTLEEAGVEVIVETYATVAHDFTMRYLDGSTGEFKSGEEIVITILSVNGGYSLLMAIHRDEVYYFIPYHYLNVYSLLCGGDSW